MTFTPEEMQALYAPFALSEHEAREGSTKNKVQWFIYVRRAAIQRRLDAIFPGEWSMQLIDVSPQKDYSSAICRITIRGISRDLNGGNSGQSGENNEKGAGSDAFKRAASMWGLGLYLQDASMIYTNGDYLTPPDGNKKRSVKDWKLRGAEEKEALQKFGQWLSKQTIGAPVYKPAQPTPQMTPKPTSKQQRRAPQKVTMSRDDFIAEVIRLGIAQNKIGHFLQEHDILIDNGIDRYEQMLEHVKEVLSDMDDNVFDDIDNNSDTHDLIRDDSEVA